MMWNQERYVRLYVRNTPDWLMLPWEGRAFLPLLLRALDRAGKIDLGAHGEAGLAVVVGLPVEVVRVGLAAVLAAGMVVSSGTTLVMPNYQLAQEAPKTDAERQRQHREKVRESLLTEADAVTFVTPVTDTVTPSHEVTTPSRNVTPCLAVPSRAVPNRTEGEAAPLPVKVQRATRIPEGWRPREEDLAALRAELKVDPLGSLPSFRDHWLGAKDGEKRDWDATFRNWVRRDASSGKLSPWEEPPILERRPDLTDEERAANAKRLFELSRILRDTNR